MTHSLSGRPSPDEHPPYYSRYIDLVPEGDLIAFMVRQCDAFVGYLEATPDSKQQYRYGPGKWSVSEVVGHLIDTERVFMHRALSIARADPADLPGFDQVAWCSQASYSDRPFADVVREWEATRRSSCAMLSSLPAGCDRRRGVANASPMTSRSLAYVPPGHVVYHAIRLYTDYGLPKAGDAELTAPPTLPSNA